MNNIKSPDWQESTTVIIPAYNEENAIDKCLTTLLELYPRISVVLVDDGSEDQTFQRASKYANNKVRILKHAINKGYGASLKTAMKQVKTPILVWFDADLQHDPKNLPAIVEPIMNETADAVLGAREKGSAFVIKRVPGKLVLRIFSQIVARQKIPDLNCGYRSFRTDVITKYLHLLPDGFSASSTTTLLMLKRNYRTIFFPLQVGPRVGKSYVKFFRDGFMTFGLIFRIVLLFDALLFFSVFALIQFLIGIGYSTYMISTVNMGIPPLGAIILISGLLTFFLGIISSQISQMRQERFELFNETE